MARVRKNPQPEDDEQETIRRKGKRKLASTVDDDGYMITRLIGIHGVKKLSLKLAAEMLLSSYQLGTALVIGVMLWRLSLLRMRELPSC